MTRSKKFWAAAALVSLAVTAFAGYSIYGRMAHHFSGGPLAVKPVPVPAPQEDEEDPAAAMKKPDAGESTEETQDGKGAGPAGAGPEKTKAVKTPFEYKDPAAKSVRLAGSFTSWKEKPLIKKDGAWRTDIYILPGTYPYHFTVDGKKKLAPGKPKAPTGDSLITVE